MTTVQYSYEYEYEYYNTVGYTHEYWIVPAAGSSAPDLMQVLQYEYEYE